MSTPLRAIVLRTSPFFLLTTTFAAAAADVVVVLQSREWLNGFIEQNEAWRIDIEWGRVCSALFGGESGDPYCLGSILLRFRAI